MADDRVPGTAEVLVRIVRAKASCRLDRQPGRDIARQRVMGGRLIGDEIEVLATASELRYDLGRVPLEADRQGPLLGGSRTDARQRVFERARRLVQVASLEPALDPRRIDLHAQDDGPGHRRGQRLRAAHATEPGRQDRASGQLGRAEMALARRRKRLVGALQDALRADVDPRSRRHLAEHRQAECLEPAELVPRRPMRHEQGICDQHTRSAGVRPEHPHRLAALHQEGLIVAEP